MVAPRDTILDRCLDSIPASALHEARAFIVDDPDDRLPAPALAVADSFAKALTSRLRALLGAAPGTLPVAEPRMQWRDVGGTMGVTVNRVGRASLTDANDEVLPEWGAVVTRLDSVGSRATTKSARLLAAAFDSLTHDPGYHVFWPTELHADSVSFPIYYHVGEIDSAGYLEPFSARIMFPAFRLAIPTITPVTLKSQMKVRYPSAAFRDFAEGKTALVFVVDKSGKLLPETIHDNWPSNRSRQAGSLGKAYEAFVKAGKDALLSAQFTAAKIGGCAAPQLVVQPLEFYIRN